jgi:hypothetical protein
MQARSRDHTRGMTLGRSRVLFILIIGCVLLLSAASSAMAWGPATHVQIATDLLGNLWLLPSGIAALLAKHRRYFEYGSVATDTVLAKKMTRVKQVCHQWSTAFSLLDSAETDEGKAFAYGYLSHLAADTVAHNKFLPRQMAVSRSTIAFGHLYWEIRADARIDKPHWQELRTVLRGHYEEPERLLEAHLRETLLSFRTNRVIFKRMNLLASERAWRRSVDFWSRLSRFQLDDNILTGYHTESLERIVDVLANGRASPLPHEDPNGNSALAQARVHRKMIKQMKRARIPHSHIILETTRSHAPSVKSLLTAKRA